MEGDDDDGDDSGDDYGGNFDGAMGPATVFDKKKIIKAHILNKNIRSRVAS